MLRKETSLRGRQTDTGASQDYRVKEMKISKGEGEREVADSYLGATAPFTLDKLFQDPDAAKEIFINEISPASRPLTGG